MGAQTALVEIVIRDEEDRALLALTWRRGSKEVCYRFPSSGIARASFKALGRAIGVDEDTWSELGI